MTIRERLTLARWWCRWRWEHAMRRSVATETRVVRYLRRRDTDGD